jgi:hypothetical protein
MFIYIYCAMIAQCNYIILIYNFCLFVWNMKTYGLSEMIALLKVIFGRSLIYLEIRFAFK